MLKKLKIYSSQLPSWFKVLNSIILLPILLWPFVLYISIFIFDNPQSLALAYSIFFAINAYPIYIIIIAELNSRLYLKNRILSLILPTLFLISIIFSVLYIANAMASSFKAKIAEDENRTKAGWLGDCDTYRKINNKIYFNDSIVNGIDLKTAEYIDCQYIKDKKQVYSGLEIVIGADPNTFEILNWSWQKDKTHCYYQGKIMTNIDAKTFTLLDNNYSKDKKSVYYYDKLVKGADAGTFEVDPYTYIGKDKFREYNNVEN
jgi:hypothetical protein